MTAALDPFPTGWFCVGLSRELGRRPVRGRWCGRSLELRRVGGRPVARVLDGGPPVPLVEQQDVVLGWFDHDEGVPAWFVPVPDDTGWSPYAGHRFDPLRTHPQEVGENAVDVAHFTAVHAYQDVEVIEPPRADGPLLQVTYAFVRKALPLGITTRPIRAEFTIQTWGLGYSFVENHVPAYGLVTRQLVLCTPVDDGRAELRLCGATHVDLPWVPRPLLPVARRFVRAGLMRAFVQDVSDDFDIWEHKILVDPPRMVKGDGPITWYRRWCRQFYRPTQAA